jgi:hypothetical protein
VDAITAVYVHNCLDPIADHLLELVVRQDGRVITPVVVRSLIFAVAVVMTSVAVPTRSAATRVT